MGRRWGALASLACAAGVAGAVGSCSSSTCMGFEPPVIKVSNAATGAPICDATVLAQDTLGDAGTIALKGTLPPGDMNLADCQYAGLPVGTFTVVASHANFGSVTQTGLVVRSEPCDDENDLVVQQVNLALPPQ